MTTFLLILHLLVCIALIGIVLIQGGKGAEVGATFGAGASQTMFGASGGQTFIGKMTTGAAVIFMLTSLALAMFWGQPGSDSIMPGQLVPTQAQPAAPIAPTVDVQPTTPAPETPAEAPVAAEQATEQAAAQPAETEAPAPAEPAAKE